MIASEFRIHILLPEEHILDLNHRLLDTNAPPSPRMLITMNFAILILILG